MSKYVIAMDMDGVLYPFDDAWNTICVEHGGQPHDFKDWVNFSEVFGDALVDAIWHDPKLFQIKEPYPEAVQMMQQLEEMSPFVEVYLVTNPGRNIDITIPAKWAWVQQWFPWITAYHFVTMHAKWLFKADMIVEDFPGNIDKWLKANPVGDAVMISRRWNTNKKTAVIKQGAVVLGLEDVVEYVRSVMD